MSDGFTQLEFECPKCRNITSLNLRGSKELLSQVQAYCMNHLGGVVDMNRKGNGNGSESEG